MAAAERTVLHVLPHPGGGGETYVDLLDEMDGYRFDRAYLARSPDPSPVELARGVAHVLRRRGQATTCCTSTARSRPVSACRGSLRDARSSRSTVSISFAGWTASAGGRRC